MRRAAMGLVALTIFLGCVGCGEESSEDSAKQSQIANKPQIAQPDQERAFIKLIIDFEKNIQVPYARHDHIEFDRLIDQFHDQLCKFGKSLHVEQWVGKVTDFGTINDRWRGSSQPPAKGGYAYLTVEIDTNGRPGAIELKTESYDAVIDEASPLFDTARKLNIGDDVTFSGDFFPNDKTCLKNASSNMEESFVTNTTYFFRFSSLAPI